MEYGYLGATDLKISRLCLGTMTWGEQNSAEEGWQQLDMAIEHGINFIDTAELYPVPPKAETYTRTETILGEWLKRFPKREDLVIASKVSGPGEWVSYMRHTGARLDKKSIIEACNASLKRLQTDYIDLYQVHWPERSTNFFGQLGYEHKPEEDGYSIEETLSALDELVSSGKVRHIGISNETPWGAMEYLRQAERHDWPKAVSIQNPYNLLNRTFEVGLGEFAHRENLGLLAYSPLAFGVLSGKYLHGARPAKGRITLFSRFSRYNNEQAVSATEAYVSLAQEKGLDPAQMALAYVTSRPFVDSNIIGATNLEQLQSNLNSINLRLDDDTLKAIEQLHRQQPNPAP
ncbi:NADP(H)-dependent aldo-keto reductase [Aestuariirhabdus sp. Z084]|uniref:NADP(H)-dependent aldo-keto reductase n=1 Tax=Aestuariirhabdus haliotis TaxID=2918751 RepID=UPI00201B40E0|nr:NADP(H)-dependent aldo-keto reductase [Aestuariirhabdus haliotis]MCL6415933.1 NADP(H)-dependent aldo-keto reductase [Aestuariirhabdus haliotis]MCL6419931.1 NADP(H)-dependent aldo-keto reductase [Aestuariirhabdus haliotis]